MEQQALLSSSRGRGCDANEGMSHVLTLSTMGKVAYPLRIQAK